MLRKLAAWARWLDWPPTPLRISIFAAARIEIELLDGSHVIAAMTINAAGSKWIPYEYGRAKDSALHSVHAAIWLQAGVRISDCGEYVWLGAITRRRAEIVQWLTPPLGCVPPRTAWRGQSAPQITIP